MLVQSAWKELQIQYYTPLFQSQIFEPTYLKLCKKIANIAKKCLVAFVCVVYAPILTPILFMLDAPCILCRGKALEVKTVLDFYCGGSNDRGYTLEGIWAFDDKTLETKHDCIQWLFPLKERGVNPTAPLTNEKTIQTFQTNPQLQQKMRKSFDVMLAFYGFERKSDGSIVMGHWFSKKAENWLNPGNHNYLRITRILRCLKLHGLQAESKAFLKALETVYSRNAKDIGSQAIRYWRSA